MGSSQALSTWQPVPPRAFPGVMRGVLLLLFWRQPQQILTWPEIGGRESPAPSNAGCSHGWLSLHRICHSLGGKAGHLDRQAPTRSIQPASGSEGTRRFFIANSQLPWQWQLSPRLAGSAGLQLTYLRESRITKGWYYSVSAPALSSGKVATGL